MSLRIIHHPPMSYELRADNDRAHSFIVEYRVHDVSRIDTGGGAHSFLDVSNLSLRLT